MKYKVGDKVRVRKDLEIDERYGYDTFTPDMKNYSGKIMTVGKIFRECKYKLKEDTGNWNWTDEMLEDVESIEGINILVKDNKVIAKRGNKVGIAKCSPEDEFDIFVGAKLALERLEKQCKPYAWLKEGVKYYYPCVGMDDLYDCCAYVNDPFHKRMISRGLVFKTKEEAVVAAKKMLAVLKEAQDDD